MPDELDDTVSSLWSRVEKTATEGLSRDDAPQAKQYVNVEVDPDPTPYRVFGLLKWSQEATPGVRKCDASSVEWAYEITTTSQKSYTSQELRESADSVHKDIEAAAALARTSEMEFVVAQLAGIQDQWSDLPSLDDECRGGRLIVRSADAEEAKKSCPLMDVEVAPAGFPLRALLLPRSGGPVMRRLVSDFKLSWRRMRRLNASREDAAQFVLSERFFLLNPAACRRIP